MGVHLKVEGLEVGDKWRNEWRERVHGKRCVAAGEGVGWEWVWEAVGVGGFGNILGSRYRKANGYTLKRGY